jgi:hypothetical protein
MQCLDRNPSKRPTIEEIKKFEYFANMYVLIVLALVRSSL